MLDEKLQEPFHGLPNIASLSTVQADNKACVKSNMLFSVLEMDSRIEDKSKSRLIAAPTFLEPAKETQSSYYTLDKLTNMLDYNELNKLMPGPPVIGDMGGRRNSSRNDSLISLDATQEKSTSRPMRSIQVQNSAEPATNDSLFRPSLIGIGSANESRNHDLEQV